MEKYELQKLRDLPIGRGATWNTGYAAPVSLSLSRRSPPVDVVLGEEEHVPLLRLRGSRRHDRPGYEVSE